MKFSIVTPSFNMDRYIAKTIESVISQAGDFEIEYILADGGSSDKTVEIFNSYREQVESGAWPVHCKKITMVSFSEKDKGTFDAINKGFARATGEMFTWADADNTYLPGAFDAVAKTCAAFPEIQWVIGVSGAMDEHWNETAKGTCRIYHQKWLQLGVYGMESYPVAQTGCFWSAELWKKSGPIPTDFRVAGDYWIWIQMAKHAPLWSIDFNMGNFMRRPGQLHAQGGYRAEQLKTRPTRPLQAWKPRLFFTPQSRSPRFMQPFFLWLYPLIYMFPKRATYISFTQGVPTKLPARSFIC